MKFNKLMIIALILFSPQLLPAQPPPFDDGPGPTREKVRERINTMKIWKLTEAVGLTSEQSEKFFPLYNKHQLAMDEIMNRRGEFIDKLDTLTNNSKASDQEIQKAMDDLKSIPRQINAELDRFYKEIAGVLPLRQQAKLAVFEDRFLQRLQEFARDVRRDKRGGRFNDE
jgi:hypothetical protein